MKFEELMEQKSPMVNPIAVIIKGNPDRMIGNETLASQYYLEIERFLNREGFKVIVDEGLPYTCPPVENVALWVGHSRGVGRIRCIPMNRRELFAKLGDPAGAVNKNDAKWQEKIYDEYVSIGKQPPLDIQPPEDHFIFSRQHKREVMKVIKKYRKIS